MSRAGDVSRATAIKLFGELMAKKSVSQAPRDADGGVAAQRPAVGRKPRKKKQSATTGHLIESYSKVYAVDSDAIQRIVAAALLMRVRDLLLRELDQVLSRFGTSFARYHVLAIICREGEGIQLSEIAALAGVHPTTLTATIDRLVRDGFIERRRDPVDRRGVFAVGTRKGYEQYREARAELAAIQYGLADIDLATVKRLTGDLDKIAELIEGRMVAR